MSYYIFGVIGQWTACIALAAGIAIEIHYQADLGFLSITIGSVLFALATKVKVIGKERVIKRVKDLEERRCDSAIFLTRW